MTAEPVWNCDHCGQRVHRDSNGWFVGEDGTSDCPAENDTGRGHQVDGSSR